MGFGYAQAKGVKSVAENHALAERMLALQRETAYNKAISDAKAAIASDEFPKTLNVGNQNKHIRGSHGYIDGRSYISGGLEDAQNLVSKYSGTGSPRLTRALKWTNKEYVIADTPIGVVVNPEASTETETKAFLIHYGKRGAHIVPTKEADEK